MKNLTHPTFAMLFFSIFFFASCQKRCSCIMEYDENVTYKKGNSVSHEGKCYKAISQGRGIKPGPYRQNGNDIWKECK